MDDKIRPIVVRVLTGVVVAACWMGLGYLVNRLMGVEDAEMAWALAPMTGMLVPLLIGFLYGLGEMFQLVREEISEWLSK